MQTLDLEFDEWCSQLLINGIDSFDYLRIKSQYRFVWDECRRRCANLCVAKGHISLARDIKKNEDDQLLI